MKKFFTRILLVIMLVGGYYVDVQAYDLQSIRQTSTQIQDTTEAIAKAQQTTQEKQAQQAQQTPQDQKTQPEKSAQQAPEQDQQVQQAPEQDQQQNSNQEIKSTSGSGLVYVFPIREQIMPAAWRQTKHCLEDAVKRNAKYIVIDMNTYGGMVDIADSIRTAILNCPIPVSVFINNQAASAGALISIAADSIFMRPGASIGAATVVDGGTGEPVADKYQSFMRGMMRSTAESHGKIVESISGSDTTWRWRRDPAIAEAMVDPTLVVEGLIDSTKVLTLTTTEALKWHFAEGKMETIDQVVAHIAGDQSEVFYYEPTTMDKIMGFLNNPILQSIALIMIIGGLYFEFQSPGIGFPLAIAIVGVLLYFSPLYFEGLLQSWEMIIFAVGLLLLLLEIFVIPGFGVAGILGIGCIIVGLTFAAIDNELLKYVQSDDIGVATVLRPFLLVVISVGVGVALSFFLGAKFLNGKSRLRGRLVLENEMTVKQGWVGQSIIGDEMIGRTAIVFSDLRPSGKVEIDGTYYDAVAIGASYVDKNSEVIIINVENGTLYCKLHKRAASDVALEG